MQTVTILRHLLRLRAMTLAIGVVAVVAGLLLAFRISFPPKLESRKYEVGTATARILVDTPASQVVDVAPKGSDVLGVRANLLANLMVDGEVKTAIARRAGLRPEQLSGVGDVVTGPSAAAAGATPTDPRHAWIIRTQVLATADGSALPIIEVEAQAPDARSAERLASASVSGLRDSLDSKAAIESVPDAKRLRVSGLGLAQARTETRGPSLVLAFVVMILVFVVGCAILLAMSALVRDYRRATAAELLEYEPEIDDDSEWPELAALPEVALPEPNGAPAPQPAAEPASGRSLSPGPAPEKTWFGT
jgi:hypothetical protein